MEKQAERDEYVYVNMWRLYVLYMYVSEEEKEYGRRWRRNYVCSKQRTDIMASIDNGKGNISVCLCERDS